MTQNARKFELVKYPFPIQNKRDVRLIRTSTGFASPFGDNILAKRIHSTRCEGRKVYIEVEIRDGKCILVSEAIHVHEFQTAADFFVGASEESTRFYQEAYEHIIDEDLGRLVEYSSRIAKMTPDESFPECPLPMISVTPHFEHFKTDSSAFGTQPSGLSCVHIKFGEAVHSEVPGHIRDSIMNSLGDLKYKIQEKFFTRLFSSRSIIKSKELEAIYKEELTEEERSTINATEIRSCLLLHAYIYSSGPWRHCWIKLGYDPATDRMNYRFQSVYINKTYYSVQLNDFPEVIAEVEKNIDWYLLPACNSLDGFVSQALRNLASYMLTKGPDS